YLWKPLLFLLLSLSVFLTLIFPVDYFQWAIVILWWLKPVYDRLILMVYSQRQIKSETNQLPDISFKEALKLFIKSLLNTSLIRDLTINRFNLTRSFRLPVSQLEKQTGHAARERVNVLGVHTMGRARNLTMLALQMELLVGITIISMFSFIIPEGFRGYVLFSELSSNEEIMQYLSVYFYILTIFLIEPLYIASGFYLYMNKRVKLEAWDIEVIFKKIAAKV
ncbi:MAG: hypothetical protein KAU21_15215, partial [Gammaproteobacteria bacterium]|nr:hypothetical protein [Gammaproteobacteria bacterium]